MHSPSHRIDEALYSRLQELYLIMRGALSICENEGVEIMGILADNPHLIRSMHALNGAVAGATSRIEDIMQSSNQE